MEVQAVRYFRTSVLGAGGEGGKNGNAVGGTYGGDGGGNGGTGYNPNRLGRLWRWRCWWIPWKWRKCWIHSQVVDKVAVEEEAPRSILTMESSQYGGAGGSVGSTGEGTNGAGGQWNSSTLNAPAVVVEV